MKSETVFSRRRDELQHSSYKTKSTSKSVSKLKHCPLPKTGPPRNNDSKFLRRSSALADVPPLPTTPPLQTVLSDMVTERTSKQHQKQLLMQQQLPHHHSTASQVRLRVWINIKPIEVKFAVIQMSI
ncbi:hypothetical protein J437_LFUL015603 [Ladona fulva]|uniref:Uncharacterized protein n=1 Tax=Ladona fulva TaxID=123851 RepID=A0A8K0KH35_LADFU|nr:hypothetical protein J437_LFUL015603 [Ladona fulva]